MMVEGGRKGEEHGKETTEYLARRSRNQNALVNPKAESPKSERNPKAEIRRKGLKEQ